MHVHILHTIYSIPDEAAFFYTYVAIYLRNLAISCGVALALSGEI